MEKKEKEEEERKHESLHGLALWPIFTRQKFKELYFLIHFS